MAADLGGVGAPELERVVVESRKRSGATPQRQYRARDRSQTAVGVIELPVEWVRDDAVYFMMNRFSALRPYTPPSDVLDIFRREFEAAYDEGGLFQLTMHPHVIGYRSRIWIVEELIRLAQSRPGVWFATHADVARYAKENAA